MFKKFPHIDQFKNCIKEVRDHAKWNNFAVPSLTFTGTVKLHGTNAAVGYNVKTGEKFCQSRERIININSDNYGFSMFAHGSIELELLFTDILNKFDPKEYIHIFGEWAGKGIQKNVAISEFEKSFYVFAISVDDQWVDLPENFPIEECNRVFFINQFPTFEVKIDFNNPHDAQNKLVELTMDVERECPVSKTLGKTGIGEGIVWTCNWEDKFLMFKTKGEKHSNSKVKTLKDIAPIDIEKMNSTKEFISSVLGENRLEQGIVKLHEMGLDPDDVKNTGVYVKWCCDDVIREERDTIIASQFDMKVLGRELATIARNYFLNRS